MANDRQTVLLRGSRKIGKILSVEAVGRRCRGHLDAVLRVRHSFDPGDKLARVRGQ